MIRASKRDSYRYLIVAGLCFSLAGDILLMLSSDQFVFGLVSFLVAHIFYIGAFSTRPKTLLSIWIGLACVAYGCLMLWFLFPNLGDLKLPVSIYVAVVLLMAWQAQCRWAEERGQGTALAAIGAILFVASDSMIAIDRFNGRFRSAGVLIMTTYFTAQLLIALSVGCHSSCAVRAPVD